MSQEFRTQCNQKLAKLGLSKLSGNIYAIGRNYSDHAKELSNPIPSEPVVFLKAPSSLRACQATSLIRCEEETFHHEIELVFLLKPGPKLDWSSVSAVCLGLDLTRRSLQTKLKEKSLPWSLSKSFAGSSILGDFVVLEENWWEKQLEFSLEVNGELKQQGNIQDMIFSLPKLLSFLNESQILEDGDLLFTGTPSGVGPLRKGDRFVMKCEALNIHNEGQL